MGRQLSHAHNVSRAAVRAESADRPGVDQRRHQAHSRLHALPAIEQSRQGGVATVVVKTAPFRAPHAPEPDRARTRRPSAPAICSSSPDRFRSIPPPAQLVDGDIAAQTRQALDNIGALLEAGGLSFADVVRTTVFLADMNDFAAMNEIYGDFFSEPYPARSTVQAARLPSDARIEIDAIAATP